MGWRAVREDVFRTGLFYRTQGQKNLVRRFAGCPPVAPKAGADRMGHPAVGMTSLGLQANRFTSGSRGRAGCTRFHGGGTLASGIHRYKTESYKEGHESKDCGFSRLRAAGCRQRVCAKADGSGAARCDGDAGVVCTECGARDDEPEEGCGAGWAGVRDQREGSRCGLDVRAHGQDGHLPVRSDDGADAGAALRSEEHEVHLRHVPVLFADRRRGFR